MLVPHHRHRQDRLFCSLSPSLTGIYSTAVAALNYAVPKMADWSKVGSLAAWFAGIAGWLSFGLNWISSCSSNQRLGERIAVIEEERDRAKQDANNAAVAAAKSAEEL